MKADDGEKVQRNSPSESQSSSATPWEFEDLYPQRRGSPKKINWWRAMWGLEGREEIEKMKCERHAYWAMRNHPLVKVLIGALNSAGCEFDMSRHISCETCDNKIAGGFDPEFNQVVICQNVARRRKTVQGTLIHELIHMFDYCVNDLDFKNIRHLACTEIRAANLAHCSIMSAWVSGTAKPWHFKGKHADCVKQKALTSVMSVKKISKEEAMKVIDEVFPQCYADLEPIGRQCRRNSVEPFLVWEEAPMYGYDYHL
ncbi:unnamed protein product [Trichogramma brassicae]|uniref:Mitochondrial inner membrane protease ATP23 n=1 Tax=Trichogramma brassicae TaxID=86971 RepID=A0A6H5IGE5_9HYME|nr:unnamed protein product [Trichogramma brassicae]